MSAGPAAATRRRPTGTRRSYRRLDYTAGPMFDALSDRLRDVLGKLSGRGRITEADVDAAMREIRLALLEADVNYNVVQEFMARVNERAVGAQLLKAVRPDQQVVKIVHDAMVEMMGPVDTSIRFEKNRPVESARTCRETVAEVHPNEGRVGCPP